MTGRDDDSKDTGLSLDLARALWPAQAADLRVFVVADGNHRSRAEVRHEGSTTMAAGAWGKTATLDSLNVSLRMKSPPSPWTYHARSAQAAERDHDWGRARAEWKHSEQTAKAFGGADEAQLERMRERAESATSVPIWLQAHDGSSLRSLDWYLTEAGLARQHGDQMLEYILYRHAWAEASRIWRRGGQRDSERLDSIIETTRRLEQEVALA